MGGTRRWYRSARVALVGENAPIEGKAVGMDLRPGPGAAAADEEAAHALRGTARSRLHTVHPARIEVELDPVPVASPRTGFLAVNARDRWVLVLFIGACLAQVADAVTTAIALQRSSLFEANSLMRSAVTQPALTGALKLLVVGLLCLLAMMRLPTRYARLAVLLAFGIGVLAPLQNALQLLTSR